jgi:hypothetical protein|eukprot:COSAG01_NODE_13965_length_1513_cov_5.898868_2_plen_57_part_00
MLSPGEQLVELDRRSTITSGGQRQLRICCAALPKGAQARRRVLTERGSVASLQVRT